MAEASRVLRPGGILLAEVITRHSWILDASRKGLLHEEHVWRQFRTNIDTGLSEHPELATTGRFFGYFSRLEEVGAEARAAGFDAVELLAVEGFGWLLANLEEQLRRPQDLLSAIRLTEREPSLLGVSGHVLAVGRKP